MAWMRIERYWRPGEDGRGLRVAVTPMLCQQCTLAPCEPVCPVFAAYHTPDGLNGQVYNRCVGTRYCANNCPYKVRHFNWYDYAERGGEWESWPDPLNMLLNPDVTVREKGVMEKCTFCVQRIRGAQNRARLEDRPVADGDITPACATAWGSPGTPCRRAGPCSSPASCSGCGSRTRERSSRRSCICFGRAGARPCSAWPR